jgi:hypothetical protein
MNAFLSRWLFLAQTRSRFGQGLLPGSELGISFSRSMDGGASWSAPVVLTEDVFVKGALPSTTLEMAASGSTVLLVVTRVMSGPGSEIFVGRSSDSGQSWPLATNLSKMSGLSLSPQIGL